MDNNRCEEIASVLKRAHTVAIACHVRPDGDALGSGLALALALQNAGKRAYMLCEEEPPERLRILPAINTTYSTLPVKQEELDLFVSVDSAELNRLGAYSDMYARFPKDTVNIDHHISNPRFGKYNYVLPDSTATCEIMPEIFKAAGFEITKDIADLLALGLLTDSGNFSHRDVSAKTFSVAALLKERGADLCGIGYEMFTRQSKARAILYGTVINRIRFLLDDRFAVITVRQEDFERTGTDKSQTEGFVDFPLSIDGVEVAAALMEVKKNQYKISLRSRRVNVNAVAATFGGGGHVLASGCMLTGEYEEVVERLTRAVSLEL